MIKALKNEFSSFFMNQSNLRAASIYLITSFVLEPIVIIEVLESEYIDLRVLLALIRLLKIGTGIWITIGLLSTNRKQRDYTRLIGLYLLFSIPNEIIDLPNNIRAMVMSWGEVPIFLFLKWTIYRVTTILSIYIYTKLIRRQIDQNLFLLLSINQIKYIMPQLSIAQNLFDNFQYLPDVETIVYLISSGVSLGVSLGFFSILAILFFEVSGRNLFFKGDERRLINWVGVALFLLGFRTLLTLFTAVVYGLARLYLSHGIYQLKAVLLTIVWVIQAIIVIYLGIRVRAHISQE